MGIGVIGIQQGRCPTKDGKEQGEWSNYWENGQLKNKSTFKAGLLSGAWESYYPTGKLKLRGKYEDNFKVGEWTDYFENGKPKDILTYKLFKEKSKVEYGIMKDRVRSDSKKDGHAVSFSMKDYRKTEEGDYKEGEKHGEWIAYYPGGRNPAVISNYKNGELDGTMKQFDKRGNLLQEMDYKEGLKHGRFIVYDKKGKAVLLVNSFMAIAKRMIPKTFLRIAIPPSPNSCSIREVKRSTM